jgi:GNAT superfamily N-acetyltransferase
MEKFLMTNHEILQIALRQSAYDSNCAPEDFLKQENIVVQSRDNPWARRYLTLPLSCDLVSYGNNIVAQAQEDLMPVVREYMNAYPVEHCFETPNLHVLGDMLRPYGQKICFMAEYFLPDVNALIALPCSYELRILHQEDFRDLYLPQWSDALCEKRKELDVLGVGAYDQGNLIGLAACSADCDAMYQIGVNVLPEYRRQGVASALTSRLALEILNLGKVPFYCAAWCNLRSVGNAIKCGFRPAWVELTARETDFVNKMNQG